MAVLSRLEIINYKLLSKTPPFFRIWNFADIGREIII